MELAKADRFHAITKFLSGCGGINDGSEDFIAQDLLTQYSEGKYIAKMRSITSCIHLINTKCRNVGIVLC